MTLEEIEALKAPQQRPEGADFESYTHLCVRAGVEGISKSGWDSLPILKAKADTEDYDLKKDEDQGLEDDEDNVGDGGSPESAGDESEAATDEDIGEDEEEEGMTDSEKSLVNTSDLMKAIEAYGDVEAALESVEPQSREYYLHARLDAGTISKSEQTELGRIWANEEVNEEPMQKSLIETLEEDEASSQLVDASDFLRNLVKGVDTRMEQVLGEVSRDGRATRELLKATGSLIKSLAAHAEQQDTVIKSMSERMEHLETTPAPRRAVTGRRESATQRQLTKSSVGGSNDELSKAQVTDALRALMIHASEKEDSMAMDRIAHATSLYEQTGTLPQTMIAAVQQVSN